MLRHPDWLTQSQGLRHALNVPWPHSAAAAHNGRAALLHPALGVLGVCCGQDEALVVVLLLLSSK